MAAEIEKAFDALLLCKPFYVDYVIRKGWMIVRGRRVNFEFSEMLYHDDYKAVTSYNRRYLLLGTTPEPIENRIAEEFSDERASQAWWNAKLKKMTDKTFAVLFLAANHPMLHIKEIHLNGCKIDFAIFDELGKPPGRRYTDPSEFKPL